MQHCIRRHEQAQKHVAFICAAPIALVSSGAFRTPSPHVTSHPSVGDRVRPAFPLYRDDQAVVVSAGGRLITSRGPGTALEFALAVVREVCGEAVAEKVAAPMCIGK